MTLVFGVGQGGCQIAAAMAGAPGASDLNVYLVNSTVRDLLPITNVPVNRWMGINEEEGLIPYRRGLETEISGGMGKDPKRCFESLNRIYDRIVTALTNLEISKERFALLVFSGAGGTGSGAAPVIARALKEVTGRKVIGAMVLPATSTGPHGERHNLREAWNTWYSFSKAIDVMDGIVLLDNDRLAHLSDVQRHYSRFNDYVARALNDMILSDLMEAPTGGSGEYVVQQNDTMDLVTALSVGRPNARKPGVAGIGRAVQMLQGPLGYLVPVLPLRRPDLVNLGQLARERLSVRDPGPTAHVRGYVLVRAPRRVLTHADGADADAVLGSIAHANCSTVVFGTALTTRPIASVTLGLTYRPEDHPRLDELRALHDLYEKQHPEATKLG